MKINEVEVSPMQYVREFFSHRLIIFITCVWFLSGIATVLTSGASLPWLAFISGILLFVVAEYIVHRFVLHEFPKLAPGAYRGHDFHHQYPNDSQYLFGPIRYDLAGYTLLVVISWCITGSFHQASAVVFGAALCQMYYQWKHFVSHRPIVPITRWGKWVKKKHLLHHYLDEEAWYGVSNPLMDVLLGTNTSAKSKNKTSKSKVNVNQSTEQIYN
jgi:ABC-type nickel/cobalt efflux system permease component RcnA